jgi:hypothetical protein
MIGRLMPLTISDVLVLDAHVNGYSSDGTKMRSSASIDRVLGVDRVPVWLSWDVAFNWNAERTAAATTSAITSLVEVFGPAGELITESRWPFSPEGDSGRVEVLLPKFRAKVTGTYTVRLTVAGVPPVSVPVDIVLESPA